MVRGDIRGPPFAGPTGELAATFDRSVMDTPCAPATVSADNSAAVKKSKKRRRSTAGTSAADGRLGTNLVVPVALTTNVDGRSRKQDSKMHLLEAQDVPVQTRLLVKKSPSAVSLDSRRRTLMQCWEVEG